MEFPKRPTRGETDEDLLRLQEEFLKNKLKPSATVVKCERKGSSEYAGKFLWWLVLYQRTAYQVFVHVLSRPL